MCIRDSFKYDEAIATADNIMTFKLAVKTIAKRHGLFASFMPKPKYGINGSGMHINMSLEKDGKNIFFDENDQMQLSKEAYYFIGGIMAVSYTHLFILNWVTSADIRVMNRWIW